MLNSESNFILKLGKICRNENVFLMWQHNGLNCEFVHVISEIIVEVLSVSDSHSNNNYKGNDNLSTCNERVF